MYREAQPQLHTETVPPGHLFHDRFKSENIENDAYLLEAVRYIHNNPVKANMVGDPSQYPWSSFNSYTKGKNTSNTGFEAIFDMFSTLRPKALKLFMDYSSRFGELVLLNRLIQTLQNSVKKMSTRQRQILKEYFWQKTCVPIP